MTSFYSSKFVDSKCLTILHQNIVMLILSDLSITALLSQVTEAEWSNFIKRNNISQEKVFKPKNKLKCLQ